MVLATANHHSVRSLQRYGEDVLSAALTNRADASQAASLLLMHVLSYSAYSDLVLHADKPVDGIFIRRYRSFLKRRKRGEPVQYIVGSVAFMDLMLNVSPACLIPRPETELLVEHVLSFARTAGRPCSVLDIGTGSGNIAIALAFYLKDSMIDAVDVSKKALSIARRNAAHNRIGGSISFYHGVLFDAIPGKKRYTIIVSNPPYVSRDELSAAQPELRWEPRKALIAKNDGLEFIEKIIAGAYPRLEERGALFLEIGYRHGNTVRSLLENNGYKQISIIKDLSNHDRIACGYKK
jgi:release factor glutamine methyltransferase